MADFSLLHSLLGIFWKAARIGETGLLLIFLPLPHLNIYQFASLIKCVVKCQVSIFLRKGLKNIVLIY